MVEYSPDEPSVEVDARVVVVAQLHVAKVNMPLGSVSCIHARSPLSIGCVTNDHANGRRNPHPKAHGRSFFTGASTGPSFKWAAMAVKLGI